MKIKTWFMNKVGEQARHYNMLLDYVRNADRIGFKEEDGCVFPLVEQILKETEKAIQVRFSTGMIDGSQKGWTTWVPKSVIVAM